MGALVAGVAILTLSFLVQHRRGARERDTQLVQEIRRVCKLATVEVAVADYARRVAPKKIDLPFTREPEAYLFFSGVASAGFDLCDEGVRIELDHSARAAHVSLPPPRLLSMDVRRFEVINERVGWLNDIDPEVRTAWFQEARETLIRAAVSAGLMSRAEQHAREIFSEFLGHWGYSLDLRTLRPAAGGDGIRGER